MNEERPAYIRCASGNNSHTDCMVRRFGDLVEILGHPLMHLTPDDAVDFATALLHAAGKTGYGGTDEGVAKLRSRIAMVLHCPATMDSLARSLEMLAECSEALDGLDREADYWRREYVASMELNDAEIDDGK